MASYNDTGFAHNLRQKLGVTSEVGLAFEKKEKKYHLESGFNQRDEDAGDFFVTQINPLVPRSKTTPTEVVVYV